MNAKKYDVYAIGNAIVDYEIEVDNTFLGVNGLEKGLMTLAEQDRQRDLLRAAKSKIRKKQAGGSAANSVVALAQLGGKGFYSCKVASDIDGIFYRDDLVKQGVDTNLSDEKLDDGETGKCLVMITPDTERTMSTFLGISSNLSLSELNLDQLENSHYLFLEGYLVSSPSGLGAMKEAKKQAKVAGAQIALTFSDPSMVKYFGEQMNEVVGDGVDLLFCNELEAKIYTETNDLSQAIKNLKKITKSFVITLGSKGAKIWDGKNTYYIDAVKTKAVDSTGAGDIYAGTFLYGINYGLSFEVAGNLASLAASKVVSQYGPRLKKSEIREFLSKVNNKN
uniref:Carbohydrate kinase family protein, PfkB n=1 Tax=uncultured Cytophagia bacterium TaxID=768505 RepID=F4MN98_9BACT|nr:sugar kinase [uncultured bacterium]CBL88133.1 carbohydrate kinase family protein, PfkB [uncultured Cytophagia bacterium]